MRLNRSSSVGATASEKMLNPRRANRLATRASTPALFSTSTTSVWWRTSVPGTVIGGLLSGRGATGRGPGRSPAALAVRRVDDDVVVAHPGGDHRVHLLAGVGAEVDDPRPVVDLVGLLDGGVDLVGRLDPHADAAH